MPNPGPLSLLARRFGSDKWGVHNYTPHYEQHLRPYRDKPISFLEIGIGGYEDPASGGSSLRMWLSYFPDASISALDRFNKTFQPHDRLKIYQGDQADEDILRRMSTEAGGFDIIVDDGSHKCSDVIKTFDVLFPLLRNGGLYVVEDTQTSYWPKFGGSSEDVDSSHTTMGYFKNLIHGINHAEINNRNTIVSYLDENIVSMHFYHNLVMVYKGDNTEKSIVPLCDEARL